MCTPPCTPSPEVTHAIRIAMKYHGRSGCKVDGDDESPEEEEEEEDEKRVEEEAEENGRRMKNEGSKKDLQGPSNARKKSVKHDARCVAVGANATLDFTLNCNSVRLTTRDTSLKTASRGERLERPETRS